MKHVIYEEAYPVLMRCPLCNADVGSLRPGTRGVGSVACRGCETILLIEMLELECRITPLAAKAATID